MGAYCFHGFFAKAGTHGLSGPEHGPHISVSRSKDMPEFMMDGLRNAVSTVMAANGYEYTGGLRTYYRNSTSTPENLWVLQSINEANDKVHIALHLQDSLLTIRTGVEDYHGLKPDLVSKIGLEMVGALEPYLGKVPTH